MLEAEDIGRCLEGLRRHYAIAEDAEITMELNPGTAAADKLVKLRKYGVNRLSIGLQSANDRELKLLGRIHTYADFLQTFQWAREAGFDNINIDLMSALPGQSLGSWQETLDKVTALEPEHISAYSLIVEEGTPLCEHLGEYPEIPDDDEDRRMYRETKRILSGKGYSRYEISNYAKRGFECRHNCIYWQRGIYHTANYAGFGLGAASTVECMRWKNTADMDCYLSNCQDDLAKGLKEEQEKLSGNDCMEEFMFLGLRMTCGVSKKEFFDTFQREMEEVYGDVLNKWTSQGLLVQEGDFVRLTDAGIDVSNVVLADFLLG